MFGDTTDIYVVVGCPCQVSPQRKKICSRPLCARAKIER